MIEIKDKSKCCGCYSCTNVCPKGCITMEMDYEGFSYPVVNKELCVECGMCMSHCPILTPKIKKEILKKSYACFSRNDEVRTQSSSGGVFTHLAKHIIEKGGIVVGAGFDDQFNVNHIIIDNIEDLEKLRGSKYVQSRIGNIYSSIKKYLTDGVLVYFSGTPCQIDGLLAYLDKDYHNLICQDVVCHGVPSPKIWQKYLQTKKIDKNTKINFRDKEYGWERFTLSIHNNEFKDIQNKLNNAYLRAFLLDYSLRPSCYDCQSKSIDRNSDITLADFWGIKKIDKKMDDDKGTSLVLLNTDKGKELFYSIKNELIYKETDFNESIADNSYIIKSAIKPKKRDEFFDDIFMNDFDSVVFNIIKISTLKRVKDKLIRDFKNFFKLH